MDNIQMKPTFEENNQIQLKREASIDSARRRKPTFEELFNFCSGGSRPYKCLYCNKTFWMRQTVFKHNSRCYPGKKQEWKEFLDTIIWGWGQ